MSQSATGSLAFPALGPQSLEVDFFGGRLTSDGGLAWLAETDQALGLTAALATVIPDWRTRRGTHALSTLVAQRVYQIACGYEDQDDADHLRTDPLLKHVCGRVPQTGADLASQPTFSRLENAVSARTCYHLAQLLGTVYLRERERDGVPTHLVLDVDGTDDPTHGDQEGTAYHGYYQQHQYFPLLVFDGETDQLITAVLRPGTVHASHGAVAILKRIVAAVRARWPDVTLELRADRGFAVPALYAWCEAEAITYTVGLATNARLERAVAPLQAAAERQSAAQNGAKVRLLGETTYQADSWPHPRRVVMKAEVLPKGTNTRFVVTTRTDASDQVYDWYVDRGASENWIKDLKAGCFADRLSCHRFGANQFRLLLHAAAYWLLDTLRRWLTTVGIARMTLETVRLRLLKIGGWVRERHDHVRLRLATSHPSETWWRALAARP
ncbi:MAG: IS1380 family transposase, partial [Chloroflexota bacterium]|nr:IS1380 family transposase [Chloroflexota bacterium]